MWTKFFADGTSVSENKDLNLTWKKTPLVGIVKVELTRIGCHGGRVERFLMGHLEYWHSRTAVANEGCKPIVVAERIQGRLPDGTWETITWNGKDFVSSIEKRALGKPVVK